MQTNIPNLVDNIEFQDVHHVFQILPAPLVDW